MAVGATRTAARRFDLCSAAQRPRLTRTHRVFVRVLPAGEVTLHWPWNSPGATRVPWPATLRVRPRGPVALVSREQLPALQEALPWLVAALPLGPVVVALRLRPLPCS